jgi:hypothetical protein
VAQKQGLRANRPQSGWVELVKDGIEAPMRCSPKAVEYWKSRGWQEKPADAAAEQPDDGGAKGAPTDPAEPPTAPRRGITGKDA